MDIREALQGSGLPSAEAETLLSGVVLHNRAWLLAHGDDTLEANQWALFTQWVDRRRKHEPVAYITGEQEFYGRPFTVDKRVLIPRPATEGIVTRALRFLEDGKDARDDVDSEIIVTAKNLRKPNLESRISNIVDVGTGSGCIAITLALERPEMRIIATDISADALEVARINAKRHGVEKRVTFKEGRGLEPVADLAEPFLLVANPPYIPSGNTIMKDVRDFEPHVALFGGASGTDVRHRLEEEAAAHPYCVGWVMEGMA